MPTECIKPHGVPDYLIEEIPHPNAGSGDVNVQTLLAVIGEYQVKLNQANSRFAEINYVNGVY